MTKTRLSTKFLDSPRRYMHDICPGFPPNNLVHSVTCLFLENAYPPQYFMSQADAPTFGAHVQIVITNYSLKRLSGRNISQGLMKE